jgi:multiple sugar transport system permease protein
MTTTTDPHTTATAALTQPPHRRARRGRGRDDGGRTIISHADLQSRPVRAGVNLITALALLGFGIVGLAPLLWLAKAATSTTQDIVQDPMALWPSGVQWENLALTWSQLRIGKSLLNTLLLASGSALFAILIATTAAYVLAVLRPRWARPLQWMILATLFIPGIIALVPLYLTVKEVGLLGNYFGLWLPAAASAFNILIVTQFFQQIPTELFEAARIDGAGPVRVFVSILLPMSTPILGVIALLTFVGSWKDFLWPLLVVGQTDLQPLSVVLFKTASTADKALFMAGMFITVLIPLLVFLIFQRQFLRSAGAAGALKG